MPLHAASAEAFESIDADAGTVTWGDDYFKDPEVLVGNGPYQLTRWSFKRELVVDANPHYWARDRVANPGGGRNRYGAAALWKRRG